MKIELQSNPMWISGNVRIPIMNMGLGHLKASLKRLQAFDGDTFKGLNKAKTLQHLKEEINHRYNAQTYYDNTLKQRRIQKYNSIFKRLDKFTRIVEQKLAASY